MLVDEAVNGCLEVGDRTKDAGLQASLVSFGIATLDGVEPEHEVSVK